MSNDARVLHLPLPRNHPPAGESEHDSVAFATLNSDMTDLSGYQEWLTARGSTPSTIRQRLSFARGRQRDWGDELDVAPHQVAAWLNSYSGWTRRTYYNHLINLFAWLEEAQEIERSPLEHYRRPHQPRPRPNPLSAEELNRVFTGATGDLRAWLLLAYFAGLRCFEVAKFRGEDINRTALVVVGKGGYEWTLPTHPELWELAQHYPRRGLWFPSSYSTREHISTQKIRGDIGAHFRANGITEGALHRLRHSYLTDLHRAGVKIRVLQELARHQSLVTTESYIAVDDDEKRSALSFLRAAS